jgi:hypothetical protein
MQRTVPPQGDVVADDVEPASIVDLAERNRDRLGGRDLSVDLRHRDDDLCGHAQWVFAHPRRGAMYAHAFDFDLHQHRSRQCIALAVVERVERKRG